MALKEPRIHIHWSTIPVEILGEKGVEGLRVRSVKNGSEEVLPVYGVFFYVGLWPNPLEGLRRCSNGRARLYHNRREYGMRHAGGICRRRRARQDLTADIDRCGGWRGGSL